MSLLRIFGRAVSFLFLLEISTGSKDIDCSTGFPEDWNLNKQGYCCHNPPHVCAPFDRGCGTPCLYMNATLSCKARMMFKQKFSMKERDDACLTSYWMVLDQCPVCHQCKAVDAGCKPSDWDCSGDPRKDKWSDKVKEFCCLKKSKGCPQDLASLPEAPMVLYDCEDHTWDWETAWAVNQKEWCCKHHTKGCKNMSNSGDPPKMQEAALKRAGLSSATPMKAAKQPPPKAADYSGYSDFLPEPSKPFHCQEALNNFRTAWSKSKKEWCCEHQDLGCDGESSESKSFDCMVDVDDWKSWTDSKKQACCATVGVGCPSGQTIDETSDIFFDCSKGFPGYWSEKKKEVCCSAGNVDCES